MIEINKLYIDKNIHGIVVDMLLDSDCTFLHKMPLEPVMVEFVATSFGRLMAQWTGEGPLCIDLSRLDLTDAYLCRSLALDHEADVDDDTRVAFVRDVIWAAYTGDLSDRAEACCLPIVLAADLLHGAIRLCTVVFMDWNHWAGRAYPAFVGLFASLDDYCRYAADCGYMFHASPDDLSAGAILLRWRRTAIES